MHPKIQAKILVSPLPKSQASRRSLSIHSLSPRRQHDITCTCTPATLLTASVHWTYFYAFTSATLLHLHTCCTVAPAHLLYCYTCACDTMLHLCTAVQLHLNTCHIHFHICYCYIFAYMSLSQFYTDVCDLHFSHMYLTYFCTCVLDILMYMCM